MRDKLQGLSALTSPCVSGTPYLRDWARWGGLQVEVEWGWSRLCEELPWTIMASGKEEKVGPQRGQSAGAWGRSQGLPQSRTRCSLFHLL